MGTSQSRQNYQYPPMGYYDQPPPMYQQAMMRQQPMMRPGPPVMLSKHDVVRVAHYLRGNHSHLPHIQRHVYRWDDHHNTYGHQIHLSHRLAMDVAHVIKSEIGHAALQQLVLVACNALGIVLPVAALACTVM
jgi:hypothetical protein